MVVICWLGRGIVAWRLATNKFTGFIPETICWLTFIFEALSERTCTIMEMTRQSFSVSRDKNGDCVDKRADENEEKNLHNGKNLNENWNW